MGQAGEYRPFEEPRGPQEPPVALRLLGLVEPVAPRAGGTLLVEGTHERIGRVVGVAGGDAGGSAEVRRALLSRHEWFRRLSSDGGDRDAFFEGTVLDGVTIRVSETTGSAGDAYLLHPWLLHGLAPHAGAGVRSMVTDALYRDAG